MSDNDEYFRILSRRYKGVEPEALIAVLCPLLIPIATIDKTITKAPGEQHYRASFTIQWTDENRSVLQRGRTGKFVPGKFTEDGNWRELAKGRIVEIDADNSIARGEIYTGGPKAKLEASLKELAAGDLLEIDQYGASAKILSALAEYYLAENARASGYEVIRMPEDMARHLGAYANFDFLFRKGGQEKRVEAKSLWGTNTEYARLIHSTTTRPKGPEAEWTAAQRSTYYPTSSCKFETQDIVAVSLFLRTGNIRDFAFAVSVPSDVAKHGLPRSPAFADHMHQNPKCAVGDGVWFSTIDEAWKLA